MHARDPVARPVEILIGILLVVVDVVFVADIERRIGKGQIDAARIEPFIAVDAVEADEWYSDSA